MDIGSQAGGSQGGLEPLAALRPILPRAERLLPYLRRIDETRLYSNHGPLAREFETRLTGLLRLPANGAVSAGSGTAALAGAILATAGRASGRRRLAIMPAYTFIGTASAAELCGYQPYIADIDPDSWMLEPASVQSLPALKKAGLVIAVSPYGKPVKLAEWAQFSARTGVKVVVDGAAGFEAFLREPAPPPVPVALSFHATKSLGAGEGGAVLTGDPDLAIRARQAMNFGFYGDRNSQCASLNGKLSEYHAAVGLAELDGMAGKLAALHGVSLLYRHFLAEAGLGQRHTGAPEVAGCYNLFQCRDEAETRAVAAALGLANIDFRLWYGGGLRQHAYLRAAPGAALPVTERLAPCLIGLPTAPDMTPAQVQRVAQALAGAVRP